jgi:hypothetical protein
VALHITKQCGKPAGSASVIATVNTKPPHDSEQPLRPGRDALPPIIAIVQNAGSAFKSPGTPREDREQ